MLKHQGFRRGNAHANTPAELARKVRWAPTHHSAQAVKGTDAERTHNLTPVRWESARIRGEAATEQERAESED